MTPPAPGLRGLARRLPPGPADLRRMAGTENAVRAGRRRQLGRDLGGPVEFVLPGLGALVVALLLFTGLRGSRRVRTA